MGCMSDRSSFCGFSDIHLKILALFHGMCYDHGICVLRCVMAKGKCLHGKLHSTLGFG